MKEIRITFKGEDFAAVSRSLIDLGIIFQVEPVDGGLDLSLSDGRTDHASTTVRQRKTKRRFAKTVAKTGTARGAGLESAKADSASGSAGARLRALVERNRATSGRTAAESEVQEPRGEGVLETNKSRPPNMSEDLSAKLLAYGDRKDG